MILRVSWNARLFLPLISLCLCGSARAQDTSAGHAPGTGSLFLAFALVIAIGVLANVYLVGTVRSAHPDAPGRLSHWREIFEFSPATLGGFSWTHLALWSLLSLFLELLMIRWISSEIGIFAYFKNFVLIACFLGFGLGCYRSRRNINLLLMFIPLISLTVLVQLPWGGLRLIMRVIPNFVGASAGTQIWDVPSVAAFPLLAAAAAVIVPIVGLITFCFVPLGQLVGWYLENSARGVLAYSLNVAAGLVGIISYTLLCFLSQPPAVWLSFAGAVLLFLLWRVPRLRWASAAVLFFCVGMLSLRPPDNAKVYWSPYQKLTLKPRYDAGQLVGYTLSTNDSWYQQILDLSPGFVESHPKFFQAAPIEWNVYNIPYHFYPQPPAVLILGSGMGNDVAAALRNGAGQITAVEIDPLILKLGRKFHFEQPYASPRVRPVLDDARSYIENSGDRFDLIVFSLLDSHTTSSHFTNIRIDNYVYTSEALLAAKRMLKPDGVFIVKFQVGTPWLAGRLQALLTHVFGTAPLQLETEPSAYTDLGSMGRFFIAGSQERIGQSLSDPALSKFVEQHRDITIEPASLTTDDWPYFYQRAPGLPLPVVVISALLILLCFALVRDTGTPMRSIRWHFFFLGAGFMLLEAQIVSKMALLFGTTWLVNSIVIGGLLLLILLSNFTVSMYSHVPVPLAYSGLLATLVAGMLVPLHHIFFPSLWIRILVATLLLCLPVFFAGIIFIRSFAREAFSGEALGSNLLGAMIGGMLESASMWTGIRSLLIFAALLYVASWLALRSKTTTETNLAELYSVAADMQ
jgi:SAM-dependent methyltransferase